MPPSFNSCVESCPKASSSTVKVRSSGSGSFSSIHNRLLWKAGSRLSRSFRDGALDRGEYTVHLAQLEYSAVGQNTTQGMHVTICHNCLTVELRLVMWQCDNPCTCTFKLGGGVLFSIGKFIILKPQLLMQACLRYASLGHRRATIGMHTWCQPAQNRCRPFV